MAAVVDPVFQALGLAFADMQNPAAHRSVAYAGYAPSHFASATWAACLQAPSVTCATTSSIAQISNTCQDASQRVAPVLRQDGPSSTPRMPPPPPPAPLLESPTRSPFDFNLLQTPDVKTTSDQEASPLVLPDVLPAESRQSGSSCGSSNEVAMSDGNDFSWSAAVLSAAFQLEPPAWPRTLWPSDQSARVAVAAAYPRSLGGDLPCLATDVSQHWATEWPGAEANSPAPTTPLALHCNRLYASEARQSADKEDMPPCALAPSFDWETPPPPPRWAFRAEAPCFVPEGNEKDKPAMTDIFQLIEGSAIGKHALNGLSFVEARALMLQLRPKDVPSRELSAFASHIAKSAFINGRPPTPPPPGTLSFEVESPATGRYEHRSGKGAGNVEKKRGGKAEARGYIRASAADARARLTFPSTGTNDNHQRGRERRKHF
mmetsp:Transcript_55819/g.88466  ORF Transcript_55819/g.88466 Transcript_55819/m.88466 type:complete len:433 (+) Transcript_55819:28-1326(+)|eukprot:CAMPEP_0169202194 /NCGR_PEP_ID=MMETSP1016-20121227/10802_1 /TAXON_ID=342587 /ORGANISM="Karlodinium micrum, Strain CCMP2283" /LENGTH=432 /DNA_ID=CAMNT_0009279153 /DNA_START=40 /DNA_END=1338 /DNA_ORIENTATION=-